MKNKIRSSRLAAWLMLFSLFVIIFAILDLLGSRFLLSPTLPECVGSYTYRLECFIAYSSLGLIQFLVLMYIASAVSTFSHAKKEITSLRVKIFMAIFLGFSLVGVFSEALFGYLVWKRVFVFPAPPSYNFNVAFAVTLVVTMGIAVFPYAVLSFIAKGSSKELALTERVFFAPLGLIFSLSILTVVIANLAPFSIHGTAMFC